MIVGKVPRLPSSNYLLLWINLMSLTSAMTLAPVKYNSHRAMVLSPSVPTPSHTLPSQRHEGTQANDQEDQIRPRGDNLSVQLLPEEYNEEWREESKEEHCVPLYSLGKDDTPYSSENNEHFKGASFYYYTTDSGSSPAGITTETLRSCNQKVMACTMNATTNFPISCKMSEGYSCVPKSELRHNKPITDATGFRLCNLTSLTNEACDNHQSLLLTLKSNLLLGKEDVPHKSAAVCVCPFGYKGVSCSLIDTELFFMEPPEKFQSQNEIKEILLKYQQTDRYFIGVTLMALLMLTFVGVLGVVACCTYIFVRLSFTFMHVMVLDEARVRSGERVHHFEQQNYLSPLDRMKLCCASRDLRDDAVELELRNVSFSI